MGISHILPSDVQINATFFLLKGWRRDSKSRHYEIPNAKIPKLKIPNGTKSRNVQNPEVQYPDKPKSRNLSNLY